jgi:hypothetical protein
VAASRKALRAAHRLDWPKIRKAASGLIPCSQQDACAETG